MRVPRATSTQVRESTGAFRRTAGPPLPDSQHRDHRGQWKLWREGEPFPQRFTGRFTDDGRTIVGRWGKAEDGTNYTTDFNLTYTRVR
jgi:hypothetical protein